ncbi:hypothetical protein BJY01DRAFT_230414 [Aspergillus pseudoustus]|uniref:Hydrophobic surface binding protein A-domain-containing protein n=1 Tax=Aspergillus pseudoustus TaxID=1810923 RepID=A0ABR4I9Z8_9EURO
MPFAPRVSWPDITSQKCDKWPPTHPDINILGLASNQPGSLAAGPQGLVSGLAAAPHATSQPNHQLKPLQDIGTDLVAAMEAAGAAFKDTVKADISSGTIADAEGVKSLLGQLGQNLERDMQQKQDDATDQAIRILEKLPDALQGPAADAVSDTLDIVSTVYAAVDGYTRFGFADVDKLLQKDFGALDLDQKHVAQAAAAASATIGRIFSGLGDGNF